MEVPKIKAHHQMVYLIIGSLTGIATDLSCQTTQSVQIRIFHSLHCPFASVTALSYRTVVLRFVLDYSKLWKSSKNLICTIFLFHSLMSHWLCKCSFNHHINIYSFLFHCHNYGWTLHIFHLLNLESWSCQVMPNVILKTLLYFAVTDFFL